MEWVTKGAAQQGTFNGNPLSVAAGLAALTEVLTKDAYDHLGKLGTLLAEGCDRVDRRLRHPGAHDGPRGQGMRLLPQGAAHELPRLPGDRPEFFYASYPWMVNRGIFMTPGDEEQWTISVQHTEDDVQKYIDAFDEFCKELAG